MLAWPASTTVTEENLAGKVSTLRTKGIINEAEGIEPSHCFLLVRKTNGTFRENHRTK